MRWYSVYALDGDEPSVVGIILEGESGELAGAALEGEWEDTDSPFRIVQDIIADGPIRWTESGPKGARVTRVAVPGQVGYTEALLHVLRPPLAPGPRGTVTRISSPHDMLNRVWERFRPEASLPHLVDIG